MQKGSNHGTSDGHSYGGLVNSTLQDTSVHVKEGMAEEPVAEFEGEYCNLQRGYVGKVSLERVTDARRD